MVQFRVVELFLSFSSHFTLPELNGPMPFCYSLYFSLIYIDKYIIIYYIYNINIYYMYNNNNDNIYVMYVTSNIDISLLLYI